MSHLSIATNNGFPWFQSGAGFRSYTVCLSWRCCVCVFYSTHSDLQPVCHFVGKVSETALWQSAVVCLSFDLHCEASRSTLVCRSMRYQQACHKSLILRLVFISFLKPRRRAQFRQPSMTWEAERLSDGCCATYVCVCVYVTRIVLNHFTHRAKEPPAIMPMAKFGQ